MAAVRHYSSAPVSSCCLSLRARVPAGPAATRGPYYAALFGVFKRPSIAISAEWYSTHGGVFEACSPAIFAFWHVLQ